jgi:alpha-glucosidase
MQWDGGPRAGFSTGEPWLPVGRDHDRVSVEAQRDDPGSILAFHRRLLRLRRQEAALAVGEYAPAGIDGDCFAYLREADGRRFLVAVNLGHAPGFLEPERDGLRGEVVLGTDAAREGSRVEGRIEFGPDEGVVVLLDE